MVQSSREFLLVEMLDYKENFYFLSLYVMLCNYTQVET